MQLYTQSTVFNPCMKKSTDETIMAVPTMLDETIVMNLAQISVMTANIIAPPPIETITSRSYAQRALSIHVKNASNIL